MYQLGGQPVVVKDGTARLENGVLAGSILHLNEGIRNVKNVLGISLEDAIDMATINPARNLKMENEIGSIKEGKKADFAIIDKDVNVYKTIRDGEVVYSKE
jgi:N-acetylglucosamine-6-phosphate deacetylase